MYLGLETRLKPLPLLSLPLLLLPFQWWWQQQMLLSTYIKKINSN